MANLPNSNTTVLVFTQDGRVEFITESLTLAERDFMFGRSTLDWANSPISHIWRDPTRPDELVNAALLLNFRFPDEAARTRYRLDNAFEMYRDNIA